MADLIADIINILDRSNAVYEWPADEAELHRNWRGDFASRNQAVLALRAQKILDLVAAHADADDATQELTATEAAAFLYRSIGPTLSGALIGSARRFHPEWELDGVEFDARETLRLQAAQKAFAEVAAEEGADTARAWFIGANPWLGDHTPVDAIREGRFAEVDTAVKALKDDSFSG
jgi:hypothetical protein